MNDLQTKSISLIADGFFKQFREFVLESEEFSDMMMKLSDEFVSDNLPIVDTDARNDVAFELVMRLALVKTN